MSAARNTIIWAVLALAVFVPLIAATYSPLLQYRQPIYIAAGFAGIAALALLLVQPLLAGNYLPGLNPLQSRKIHRFVGVALLLLVIAHIIGLWITSPPDVIDVLLFRSPTPFSLWGAIAMWAVFATAALAALKKRLKLKPRTWRTLHMALAIIIAGSTIAHAMLIDGTMEWWSKVGLCMAVGVVTAVLGWRVLK